MVFIQMVSFLFIIITIILSYDLYNSIQRKRLYIIPIAFCLLHGLIFYVSKYLVLDLGLFPNYMSYFSFTFWSSILRLQEILTAFLAIFILGRYDRKIANIFHRGV